MHEVRWSAPKIWVGNAAEDDRVSFLPIRENDADEILVSQMQQKGAFADAGATAADLAAMGQEEFPALVLNMKITGLSGAFYCWSL